VQRYEEFVKISAAAMPSVEINSVLFYGADGLRGAQPHVGRVKINRDIFPKQVLKPTAGMIFMLRFMSRKVNTYADVLPQKPLWLSLRYMFNLKPESDK